ncbi:MAG: hypothetical protein CVV62_00180 [Tenericutes bacterium HGW-Tenericutes-7]|nr:MAG: hypothetical protein CVV62_00180 [Tenericutes bacterium HGW-Tenericutes-7]
MSHNILSIDKEIFQAFVLHGARVAGIYKSTMHISLQETILTLGDRVGFGKHHIVCKEKIPFSELDYKVGDDVKIENHILTIASHQFIIHEAAIIEYKPFDRIYTLNQKSYQCLKALREMIEKDHDQNLFRFPKDNPWLKYQFEKIQVFLAAPGLPSALSILGLGMGLTPLGDDILTGFILGLQAVGKTLPWIPKLIETAKIKTSQLSYQNLKDTYDRYYPNIFIDMMEGVFTQNDIEKAKAILNLGATSGAGILTGFIYGCM